MRKNSQKNATKIDEKGFVSHFFGQFVLAWMFSKKVLMVLLNSSGYETTIFCPFLGHKGGKGDWGTGKLRLLVPMQFDMNWNPQKKLRAYTFREVLPDARRFQIFSPSAPLVTSGPGPGNNKQY
jgi:hypothetical protein